MKGYELFQLRDMNELSGSLKLINLENTTGKYQALESKMYQKSDLKELHFVWSSENDTDADDSIHLEIAEGLMPPPQLKGLTFEGYKSATYPSWLLEGSYFENLQSFGLVNCCVLEGLPLDTKLFWYCSKLLLNNVPNLKTLPCLPAGLTHLSVIQCPLLMFITNYELERHDQWENLIKIEHLASRFPLIWEVASVSSTKKVLHVEHSSLTRLMPQMDHDISKHLQTIESALEEERDEVLDTGNVVKAWLCCQEQRIRLVHEKSIGQLLIPPSGLKELHLSSCNLTDGALTVCLGVLNSLRFLALEQIMTLTTLPSEEIFRQGTMLEFLSIRGCWCLRLLGGLRAAASLSTLKLLSCPSLELARGGDFMPLSIEYFHVFDCILEAEIFCSDLRNLKVVGLYNCRSMASLSVGHLTSLEAFSLYHMPDLCVLEGLSSLQLHHVHLINVPKLTAECISVSCQNITLC